DGKRREDLTAVWLQLLQLWLVSRTVRLLLAAAGQEYEDNRYPLSFGVPGDFSTIVRKDCCFCFLRTGQE
ncbi:unnamed protein product, partial [Symbiodinium sp. KB8]